MYIDIHTHHFRIDQPALQVVNLSDKQLTLLCNGEKESLPRMANLQFCAGIHPWWADSYLYRSIAKEIALEAMPWKEVFSSTQLSFIGEIGLDKCVSVSNAAQHRCFTLQLDLASAMRKPVIIHCVRAMEEVFHYKKQYPNILAWLVHGFSGGPEQASQWIGQGFYLSFGDRFRPDALLATPMDKIFLETDAALVNIEDIYQRAADTLSMPISSLEAQIQTNWESLKKR